MVVYISKRMLSFVPTLLTLAVLVFFMIHLVPGDPAQMMLGIEASPQAVSELRVMMGLDRPLLEQLVQFTGKLLQGDLGRSYYLERPVVQAIHEAMPATLSLAALALVVSVGLGIPAGVVAAVHKNSWVDATVMGGALLGISVPNFWIGLNLIFLLSVKWGLFPTGGYTDLSADALDWLWHMILPAIALGVMQAALIARMTRASMLEVLRMDYIRTARAKGLAERTVIYKHAFKNSLIPVITVIGVVIGLMLGGSVVIESVFTLPGMGRLVISAVQRRDYPVVQGVILFIAAAYMAVNLVVDITYGWVNPRIRYT